MYDRILVPTDGSAGGERAIRHGISLAEAHDADVHAIYVVNTASYGGLPMETSWEGVRDVLTDEGEEALDRIKELAGDRLANAAVIDGSPAKRIVSYAAETDCDLIVMGTHGRSGVDRLLLGSVAERVVRVSEVPVLTVRVGGSDDSDATPSDEEVVTPTPEEPSGDAPADRPDEPTDRRANVDGA